jgi:hypothetical protein
MRSPITDREIHMTARDRLARAIGLYHSLSEADREDIVDQGLASSDDFEPSDDPFASDDDPPTYAYRGSRWGVEFRNGRPHLVEAINVPLPSAVAQTEHAFAFVIHMLEQMWSTPMTDEKIADLREDGWEDTFRHAAERDGEGSGAEGTDINDGVGRNHASDETEDDAGEKGEHE